MSAAISSPCKETMDWSTGSIALLFSVIIINYADCDNDNELLKKIYNQTKIMSQKTAIKHCNPKREGVALSAQTAQLWSKYDNCRSRLTPSWTKVVVRAYAGSLARLPCRLCVSPIEKDQLIWLYAASMKNLSFNIVENKEYYVVNVALTIYYTRREDGGVYQCRLGRRRGGLLLLEVTDDDAYAVVKPLSSHGPYATAPEVISEELVMFTLWGVWGECSCCDSVGRRRRYGICYVALVDAYKFGSSATRNISQQTLDEDTLKLFQAYPKGLPCRSQMLPLNIRSVPKIQSRSNEIMIKLCKVPCEDRIFEIRSESGEVVERANNSAGIYSLRQTPPPQTPAIARKIVFVSPGTKIHIVCPGSILRDVPVTWRIGNELVVYRNLAASSGGRVHFNARDHLVVRSVAYADANIYSCWQADILAGVLKLEVVQTAEQAHSIRFVLIALIVFLSLMLKVVRQLLDYRLRHV